MSRTKSISDPGPSERADSLVPFDVVASQDVDSGGQGHVVLVTVKQQRIDSGEIPLDDTSIVRTVGELATFLVKTPMSGHSQRKHALRLQREVRLLEKAAGLSVPRVGGSHFDLANPASSWLALSFVEGTDLATLAQEGQVSAEDVPSLAAGLWRLISDLHDREIAHRDISWRNIIVPRIGGQLVFGAPVLIDFGIGGHPTLQLLDPDDPDKNTGSRVGTDGFRPPEVIRDTRDLRQGFNFAREAPIDLFQWGCSVYAAWSGHPPFDGRTPGGSILDHAYASATTDEERAALLPSDLDQMPKGLGAAIRIALSWDATDRRAEDIERALPIVTGLDSHEDSIAALEREAEQLRHELDAAETKTSERHATFDEARRKLKGAEKELQELRKREANWSRDSDRIAQLEAQASQRGQELKAAQNDVTRLTAELAKRDKSLTQERSEKELLETKISVGTTTPHGPVPGTLDGGPAPDAEFLDGAIQFLEFADELNRTQPARAARGRASSVPRSPHRAKTVLLVVGSAFVTYVVASLLRLGAEGGRSARAWFVPLAVSIAVLIIGGISSYWALRRMAQRQMLGNRSLVDQGVAARLALAVSFAMPLLLALALASGDVHRVVGDKADGVALALDSIWPPPRQVGGWFEWTDVAAGACVSPLAGEDVLVTRCDLDEHEAEVLNVGRYAGEAFPGSFDSFCDEMAATAGRSEGAWAFRFPSRESFADGERRVLCTIRLGWIPAAKVAPGACLNGIEGDLTRARVVHCDQDHHARAVTVGVYESRTPPASWNQHCATLVASAGSPDPGWAASYPTGEALTRGTGTVLCAVDDGWQPWQWVHAGACLAGSRPGDVLVVTCAAEHDARAVGEVKFAGDDYPDDHNIWHSACTSAVASAGFDAWRAWAYMVPRSDGFADGIRTVFCTAKA